MGAVKRWRSRRSHEPFSRSLSSPTVITSATKLHKPAQTNDLNRCFFALSSPAVVCAHD